MNIILVGDSCTGKTEIKNYLSENFRYDKVITYTTRKKRDEEVDGEDYNFVTLDKFIELVSDNDVVCVTSFGNDYYGLPIEYLSDNNKILVLDWNGVYDYVRECDNDNYIIINVRADERSVKRYREKRGVSEKEAKIRAMNDRIAYFSILDKDCNEVVDYHVVQNDTTIENVVTDILTIIAENR